MTVNVQQDPKYSESKEYLDKQQNIDSLLVLAKLMDLQTSAVIQEKVTNKISQILDKL